MAKFRTNHSSKAYQKSFKRSKTSSRTILLRSIFFFIGICIVIYILSMVKTDSWDFFNSEGNISTDQVVFSDEEGHEVVTTFYPESTTGVVIEHQYYTLSYSEQHEQAEWVTYKLTRENLRKPRVKRAKKFSQDNAIKSLSAKHNDYTRSGYTRGHLAPAGDMAFSEDAMRESFFMSNMSPQIKEFNGGIWRELEENVRAWASDNEELYIVTGPILNPENIIKKIGYNEVSVPNLFYKIILDIKDPEKKALAFLIPNEKSEQHLKNYVVSIDEIEELTGINYFADFLSEELESELEKKGDPDQWSFDSRKFKKRIEKWNNY